MSVCPICNTKEFINIAKLMSGVHHVNTGVWKNTCVNNHVSYYKEATKEQLENDPS